MPKRSRETQRDLELAAELRAAGASWDTAAALLHRQPHVLSRWSRVYLEDWERLLAQAEKRQAKDGADARTALRKQLQSRDAKIRIAAASQFVQQRRTELAAEPLPQPASVAARFALRHQMTDQEREEFFHDILMDVYGKRESGDELSGG